MNEHEHVQDHSHDHDHDQAQNSWLSKWPLLTALLILVAMQVLELGFELELNAWISLLIYIIAYLLAGYPVLYLAFKKASRFDFFNEFVLMSVATLGAFAIGAYSEGVAVMVFYSIGEWFQDAAVDKAKRNIKALLDFRPDRVDVIRGAQVHTVKPQEVSLEETIQVKPGEKLALDGVLRTQKAFFNTAALTGESKPEQKTQGEQVYAGMINLNQLIQVQVKALFKDSKLSKILEMVQDATTRKSRTQLFISRFAAVYTPIVFLLALIVVVLPFFLVDTYIFRDWLYRGLVFLVISCPCALVVSIPLGYFGGIGLASKNGVLFKGANFLDVMTKVDTIVMDKTGTLTLGVFKVQELKCVSLDEKTFLQYVAALERKSSHPIAVAITAYASAKDAFSGNEQLEALDLEELAGLGLKAQVNGRSLLIGNARLLRKYNISYDTALDAIAETIVVVAIDDIYEGYLRIADELKPDAKHAVESLQKAGLQVVMLSGDRQSVVESVAGTLGITNFAGDLMPEQKVERLSALKAAGHRVAFVGDGLNDAPVIALADAGIAMGGLGSDAAIETADIVIQNDQPSKIPALIKVGNITRNIVWQNICLAMGVKVLVLILGAGGVATLWEAVIADVGVALLAILNAVRIQNFRI
ncbi:heavy metal translocating P-type ATPase [Pedobacter sp. SAFR-022]|uniref:heavy metal translocating P-type ATPase n=1 Tax=Pedobacter sp. SAFR-022 TaxID=3436861 RepID=UPI003F7F4FE0